MFNKELYPIIEYYEEYYNILEDIRKSGVINMFSAASYLEELYPHLSPADAKEILIGWMANYDELSKKYNWR